MKLSMILLSCILVGVLAKPSSELEERQRRSTDLDQLSSSGSPPGGSDPLTLSLPNVVSSLPNILSTIPQIVSEVGEIASSALSGNTSTDMVRANIETFLDQINPLSTLLTSVPVVGTIYNEAIAIASLPITIVVKVVGLILQILKQLLPGFILP